MRNKIQAVIFDMDGVITDTQHVHDQANAQILQSYGIPLTAKDLSKWAGIPQRKVFEKIFTKYNVKTDIEKACLDKWKLVTEKAKKIDAIPGVIKLFQELNKRGIPLAVASSCIADFINHVLTILKINNYFKAIISTDQVKKGKPNPDIFLLAAKKLHVNPNNCVVFEDAPSRVAAAKAAGMKCIAITTTHTKKALEGADKIIDNFSELTIPTLNNL